MSSPNLLQDELWLRPLRAATIRRHGALLFPAGYHVGMSSLATHTLHALLNRDGLACERVFLDPERPEALVTLETGRPLRDLDFLALTSSYELDWLTLPAALARSGLPPQRTARGLHHPLVLMGGPALTAAPLPLSGLYDAALIGEIEPVMTDLRAALLADSREEALERLAGVPGWYVPTHHGRPGPRRLVRRGARDLNDFDTTSVLLTPHTEFAHRFLLEMGRGCGRGCRFCLARQTYSPLRWRSPERLLGALRQALPHTRDVGLVAAAVSDYPDLEAFCGELATLAPDLRVSTSSVRMESASSAFLGLLARGGQQTVTYAPEAATASLRQALGKPISDDDLRAAIERALRAGLTRIRLYFMLGLPGETDADREALVELGQALPAAYPRAHFRFNLGAFSPRPHTPFEHEPMMDPRTLQTLLQAPAQALRRVKRLEVSTGSARAAALQCLLSRSDERLIPVLAEARDLSYGSLRRHLQRHGLDREQLLGPQEPVADQPWKVVDCRCGD